MYMRHAVATIFFASFHFVVEAHDYWLNARPVHAATGGVVGIELCGGHRFPESEFAIASGTIDSMEIYGPSHVTTVGFTNEGKRLVAEWTPVNPGVYRIDCRLKRPRDENPFALARALVIVDTPDNVSEYAGGNGLEIVPRSAITTLRNQDTFVVDVLYNGEKIAAEIGFAGEGTRMIYRNSRPDRPAAFTLSGPGHYLLLTRHRGAVASLSFGLAEP